MVVLIEDEMRKALVKLKKINEMFDSLIVSSSDGLPVASFVKKKEDEDKLSAMTATLLEIGERITDELDVGGMEEIWIRGKNKDVYFKSIGYDLILAATINKPAKLGVILYDAKKAVNQLRKLAEEAQKQYETPELQANVKIEERIEGELEKTEREGVEVKTGEELEVSPASGSIEEIEHEPLKEEKQEEKEGRVETKKPVEETKEKREEEETSGEEISWFY